MVRLISVVVLALVMAALPAGAATTNILAFGDSLTAGLGVAPDDAFPVKLEAALRAKGHDVRVINGGVSGDTSSAGRERLDWVLGDDVDVVIVELGANDALRGIDPKGTDAALADILARLASRKLPVLLAGMRAPRNLGPDYVEHFDAVYPKLAQTYDVLFYPFFLDGVAAAPGLNQPDGMHPTAKGVDVIVARILPKVEELIARVDKK
jgi:acyl-CoA thioesterase-1